MRADIDYFDGFTEQGFHWRLTAEGGAALVVASWLEEVRVERTVTIAWPDDRTREIFESLSPLPATLDGMVDDLPHRTVRVEIDGRKASVCVRDGLDWADDERRMVAVFDVVWRPIEKAVESAVGFQRRR